MRYALTAVGVDLPRVEESLENRTPLRGVLCRVDEPSLRAPQGSSGHRVLIPRAVAERALPSLISMPINYADDLRGHDKKQPIGSVLKAYLDGKDLRIEGILFKKNNADAVEAIQSRKGQLGLSYEVSGVEVADTNAAIWTLTDFHFSGCAILRQADAAYGALTSIAARAATVYDCWTPVQDALRRRGQLLDGMAL